MSDWKAELEAMLAQANDLSQRASIEPVSLRSLPVVSVSAAAPVPVDVVVPSHPKLADRSRSEREEIKKRVESFRAHQRRFAIEREKFCSSVIAQMRLTAFGPPVTPIDVADEN